MKTKSEKDQIAERLDELSGIIKEQNECNADLLGKIGRVSEYILYPPKDLNKLNQSMRLGLSVSAALSEYRALLTEKYNQI